MPISGRARRQFIRFDDVFALIALILVRASANRMHAEVQNLSFAMTHLQKLRAERDHKDMSAASGHFRQQESLQAVEMFAVGP